MAQYKIIDRFIDADREPTKTLTPIKGYEKSELVSLEDAVAGIQPPIEDVDTMVWTAKRNSSNPTDGLTPDESACIHLYTLEWPEADQSIYYLLNEKLRSEKRRELVLWHPYLKLFLTALYKLPSLKTIVWRGIRGNVNNLYQKDFIWWGVSSCTETMKVMERFVGYSGERTIFMIECLNGKAIESHSFYKDEREIILMPGTYLRVIDKWTPAYGLHMIRLKEDTPPFPLVAPPFISLSSANSLPSRKLTISETRQSADQVTSSNVSSSIGTLSSNQNIVTKNDQSDYSATPYKSPSSFTPVSSSKSKNYKSIQIEYQPKTSVKSPATANILPSSKSTIIKISKPDYQPPSIEPDTSKRSEASLLSSSVKYKNPELERKINDDRDSTSLWLDNSNLTDDDMQIVAYYLLQNNKTPTTLWLDRNQIGEQGARYLGEALAKNTTLTELRLANNQIGEQGARYLREALAKNKTLTRLWLFDNQIGEQGARYLGEALAKNTTLTEFQLEINEIGDQGARYLSEVLAKNNTLTRLSLSDNHIGVQGARCLGEALANNKTLTEFRLDRNKISDKGAQYLGEALGKNTTLTELSLSSNQISEQGARYLGEALTKNTILTELSLGSNKISEHGTQYLGEALGNNTRLVKLLPRWQSNW